MPLLSVIMLELRQICNSKVPLCVGKSKHGKMVRANGTLVLVPIKVLRKKNIRSEGDVVILRSEIPSNLDVYVLGFTGFRYFASDLE